MLTVEAQKAKAFRERQAGRVVLGAVEEVEKRQAGEAHGALEIVLPDDRRYMMICLQSLHSFVTKSVHQPLYVTSVKLTGTALGEVEEF